MQAGSESKAMGGRVGKGNVIRSMWSYSYKVKWIYTAGEENSCPAAGQIPNCL